jgi:hypothetical protein
MVESMMGDTCVYIPIYGMGLVYTWRCTSWRAITPLHKFIDNDVEIGNVVGYVNSSSKQCLEIENCIWEYNEIKPRPWDERNGVRLWQSQLIHVGEEFFCHFHVNFWILTFIHNKKNHFLIQIWGIMEKYGNFQQII